MKTIKEWLDEAMILEAKDFAFKVIYKFLAEGIREEALEHAEAITRRDGHNETGDKIAAQRSLP